VSTNAAIRDEVTKQIIDAIESGKTLPWRRPWNASPNVGRPANFVSGRAYSGVNPLLLQIHSDRFGFQSKWWGTFRQWSEIGASVKRRPDGVAPGRWGATIVFYKPITKKRTEANGEEHKDRFFLLRMYTVFCADQVEGGDRYQVSDLPDGLVALISLRPMS
jgi:antirestriction protein ArdC